MMTRRQHEVLAFVGRYVAHHGFAPSYEEIAAALQMSSKSGVHYIVRQLEERGRIRRLPGRARAIEIILPSGTVKGAE